MTIQGVSSGLSGINRQREAMDRAAEKIARATIASSSGAPGTDGASADSVNALVTGTVEQMVATRMLTAAIKMAQTVNEGVFEALRVGGYSAAA